MRCATGLRPGKSRNEKKQGHRARQIPPTFGVSGMHAVRDAATNVRCGAPEAYPSSVSDTRADTGNG